MADDLGYGDLGCYGSEKIATPHIDALAAGGLRCTDFYAAGAWCMPSWIGLMSGVHPYRGGLGLGKRFAARTTMAELLKARGYATALVGKWHLGMGEGLHPLEQGFDSFYGTAGSNDVPAPVGRSQTYDVFKTAKEEEWPVPLFRGRVLVEKPAKQSLFTERYTEEAVRFVRANREKPFFLYVAHNMPHAPIFASKRFAGRSKAGLYGDVVEELDWSVGEIVKALEEEGLVKKTLVVFTSDNGPWSVFKEFGGTAKPLRGEKGTGWEGGAGVPAIFSWPGKIAPGVSDAFMVNLDLYATVANLCGAPLPTDYTIDAFDMGPVLFQGKPSPRRDYLFFSGAKWREPFSYRSGKFKFHVQTNDVSRDPDTGAKIPAVKHEPGLLFDLSADRAERKNVAGRRSAIVRRLSAEFERAVAELRSEP